MRIASGGNVGIGTTSPGSKLTVIGDIATSTRVATDTINGYTGGSTPLTIQTSGNQNLIFGTNGSERMRILSGGDVLLHSGTTTGDGYKLQIIGSNQANSTFAITYTSAATFSQWVNGSGAFVMGLDTSSGTTERLRINSSGNVGIGTTDPTGRLDVRGGDIWFNRGTGNLGNRYLYINKGASNDGGILLTRDNSMDWQIVNATSTGNLIFYSYGASSEVLNILRSNGNVGIGTSSPSEKLHVIGNILASADVIAYSDARVKTNIQTIEDALSKVLKLRGVTYNRTDSTDTTQKLGVIAQEIQQVIPQVVQEQTNGMLGVSYGNIAGLFIEAFKEQQQQIEKLTKLVNQLTKQL
jgi:hypothetical protein